LKVENGCEPNSVKNLKYLQLNIDLRSPIDYFATKKNNYILITITTKHQMSKQKSQTKTIPVKIYDLIINFIFHIKKISIFKQSNQEPKTTKQKTSKQQTSKQQSTFSRFKTL
jgi:hypothetical protein